MLSPLLQTHFCPTFSRKLRFKKHFVIMLSPLLQAHFCPTFSRKFRFNFLGPPIVPFLFGVICSPTSLSSFIGESWVNHLGCVHYLVSFLTPIFLNSPSSNFPKSIHLNFFLKYLGQFHHVHPLSNFLKPIHLKISLKYSCQFPQISSIVHSFWVHCFVSMGMDALPNVL